MTNEAEASDKNHGENINKYDAIFGYAFTEDYTPYFTITFTEKEGSKMEKAFGIIVYFIIGLILCSFAFLVIKFGNPGAFLGGLLGSFFVALIFSRLND